MPFRLRVSDFSDQGSDLAVSGQLVSGGYAGPECVLLCDREGQWIQATVTDHSVDRPASWPIVPGDGSTLTLRIPKPSERFRLDASQLIVGQGTLVKSVQRVDISDSLADPAFWGICMSLHLDCDELPEPTVAWGLTREAANEGYADRFESNWALGIWPYVRFALPEGRYVEIEYAAGVEHQDRVWIGVDEGRRVLLGYDSGHFSLPTLRVPELLELANRMEGHPSAPLLLLAGTYLVEPQEFPADEVRRWLVQSPGFRQEYLDDVLGELAQNTDPDLAWELDDERGWTNNGPNSQRNPESMLSILGPEEFAFIRTFFRF